jgi:glycosyltransferase involved in cell wall biosynthesis
MTTVSIAMCTFNGEAFLIQQLNSLAAQTHQPDEIIICDDASNDKSVAIAQAFAKDSGLNVRIHRNDKNLGYVKNFEQAIGLCTQDLIFLCDQDDLWYPEKIKQMVDVFDAEPEVGLVLHDFCWIDDFNQPYPGPIDTYGPHQLSASQLPEEIRKNSINVFMQPYPRAWCGCMMAYRRSFNELVLPIFPGKGHDDWILKLLAPITETRFIANPLVRYRMHQQNTNRRDLEKRTLKYLFKRFTLKLNMFIKGHNKRNFYSSIALRLSKSNMVILHPHILKQYKKFI